MVAGEGMAAAAAVALGTVEGLGLGLGLVEERVVVSVGVQGVEAASVVELEVA